MSQENVEIVRRAIAALNRRGIDQVLTEADDDFVIDWSNSIGPAKGVYRGEAEIRRFWRDLEDAFDVIEVRPPEFIEIGDDRVMIVGRTRVRGRGSGVSTEVAGAQLWTIRATGKLGRIELYQSKAEALEAAGLSE